MAHASVNISEDTASRMADLAKVWDMPPERHKTKVIERCVFYVWMDALEAGTLPPQEKSE